MSSLNDLTPQMLVLVKFFCLENSISKCWPQRQDALPNAIQSTSLHRIQEPPIQPALTNTRDTEQTIQKCQLILRFVGNAARPGSTSSLEYNLSRSE
jgi:hypothetical protein